MVQEFHVLRCCSCETFQVHQVKKAMKWACKLCSQKQSYVKVYGQGSGADCRRHVQKLNLCRGSADEAAFQTAQYTPSNTEIENSWETQNEQTEACSVGPTGSRWRQYLSTEDDAGDEVSATAEVGRELFTTSRQEFDQKMTIQRKERRQRFKEQRLVRQGGTWYKKPQADQSGHKNLPAYPMLERREQCISPYQNLTRNCNPSSRAEHSPNLYSSQSFVNTAPLNKYDHQGCNGSVRVVENLPSLPSGFIINECKENQSKESKSQSHVKIPKEKETLQSENKVNATAPTSKWSLFVEVAKSEKSDSEEDEEDSVACGLKDFCSTNAFENHSKTLSAPKFLPFKAGPEVSDSSEICPKQSVSTDAVLFSTEDDFDDLIGDF